MWFRLRPHLDIARTLHFSVGRFIGVVSRLKIYWQLVPKRAHPHSSGDWRQVVGQPEMIGVLATRSGQEAVERSSRRLSSERGPHGAGRHIKHANWSDGRASGTVTGRCAAVARLDLEPAGLPFRGVDKGSPRVPA